MCYIFCYRWTFYEPISKATHAGGFFVSANPPTETATTMAVFFRLFDPEGERPQKTT